MNYLKRFNSYSELTEYLNRMTEVYESIGLCVPGSSVYANLDGGPFYTLEVAVRKPISAV